MTSDSPEYTETLSKPSFREKLEAKTVDINKVPAIHTGFNPSSMSSGILNLVKGNVAITTHNERSTNLSIADFFFVTTYLSNLKYGYNFIPLINSEVNKQISGLFGLTLSDRGQEEVLRSWHWTRLLSSWGRFLIPRPASRNFTP